MPDGLPQLPWPCTCRFACLCAQLDFGAVLHRERAVRQVAIFNNGPDPVRYDASYGSAADMAAIASSDVEGITTCNGSNSSSGGGTSSGVNGRVAALVQMARIRVCATNL